MEFNKLIELISVIFGVGSIYFSIKRLVFVYPVGLVSICGYIYLCYIYGIYADLWVQVLYGIMSLQGWWCWYHVSDKDHKITPLILPVIRVFSAVAAAFLLWPFFWWILTNYSDSTVAALDSFTTAFAVVGMWLMVYQYRAHWIFWIVVNSASMPLYWSKHLYFSSLLYLLALVMAVIGWHQWSKKVRSASLSSGE